MRDWVRRAASKFIPRISRIGSQSPWEDRLVFLSEFGLSSPAEVGTIERIIASGAAHGLNGAVIACGLDWLTGRSKEFMRGLAKVESACRRHRVELIPAVFSLGFGDMFLHHNRHLAEGLPVRDAPFLVGDDGTASLIPDPSVMIRNGNFEQRSGNTFSEFGYQDAPGLVTFADTQVYRSGHCSLRLENFKTDKWGHARISQKVLLRPYRSYRISIWVKTEGLKPQGVCRLVAVAPDENEDRDLLVRDFDIPETTDWQKISTVFNSQEHQSLILVAGIWEGKEGKVWLDDWSIQEIGPQHVLRRTGTPISVASEDGETVYEEGRDFHRLEDPDMNLWQNDTPAPPLTITPRSRIRPGDRIRLGWYHPVILFRKQIGICLGEPQIYQIAEQEAKALFKHLKPKRIFLDISQIRIAGTCANCANKDMSEMVGQAAARMAGIIRSLDPKIPIYIWADMFDPHHEADHDPHFFRGKLTDVWKYLPRDLIMVHWGPEPREKSLGFLMEKGFPVLGACHLDPDNPAQMEDWIRIGRIYGNLRGFMYASWQRNFDMLPHFCNLLK